MCSAPQPQSSFGWQYCKSLGVFPCTSYEIWSILWTLCITAGSFILNQTMAKKMGSQTLETGLKTATEWPDVGKDRRQLQQATANICPHPLPSLLNIRVKHRQWMLSCSPQPEILIFKHLALGGGRKKKENLGMFYLHLIYTVLKRG